GRAGARLGSGRWRVSWVQGSWGASGELGREPADRREDSDDRGAVRLLAGALEGMDVDNRALRALPVVVGVLVGEHDLLGGGLGALRAPAPRRGLEIDPVVA